MINDALMKPSSKKENIISWIAAFLFYLTLFPYFVWDISQALVIYPLMILLLLHLKKVKDVFFPFFLFTCFWGSICGGANMFGIIMTCTYALFFIVDDSFLMQIYTRYRLIYVVLIALSLIVYLMVSMGVPMPYRISPPPPRNTIEYDYYIFPFFASPSVDDWRNLGINRFNGLFDEPGVVGTISFLFLFIERFNFKKIGNIILLLSGIFSFSLFFYLAVAIYGVYFFLFKRQTRFRSRLIVGIIVALLITQFAEHEVYEGFIGSRLEWNANANNISGADRNSDDLINYIHSIRGSSDYFFGTPEKVTQFNASASLEKQIVAHGFITVFLFFMFFLFFSYKYLHFSKEWFLFFVVFVATMYNRPTMFSYERLLLFVLAIFAWSNQYGELLSQSVYAPNFKNGFLNKI